LHRVVAVCLKIQGNVGTKLSEFTKALETEEDLVALRSEVEQFSARFSMPGVIN
jgi:glycine hydroxymethyltransferase